MSAYATMLQTAIVEYEKLLLPYVYTGFNEEGRSTVVAPLSLLKQLNIEGISYIPVSETDGVADYNDIRDFVYRHGHISTLITLYYMEGSFRSDRHMRVLVEQLLKYVITNNLIGAWNYSPLFRSDVYLPMIHGECSLKTLVPSMALWDSKKTKHIHRDVSYQYILPLFLCLNNNTVMPADVQLQQIFRGITESSLILKGGESWGDIVDDSVNSKMFFQRIVERTEDLFNSKGHMSSAEMKHALDTAKYWLSIGAYITLVSKYARYTLPLGSSQSLFKMVRDTVFTDIMQGI